jgi:hypothetical protein
MKCEGPAMAGPSLQTERRWEDGSFSPETFYLASVIFTMREETMPEASPVAS